MGKTQLYASRLSEPAILDFGPIQEDRRESLKIPLLQEGSCARRACSDDGTVVQRDCGLRKGISPFGPASQRLAPDGPAPANRATTKPPGVSRVAPTTIDTRGDGATISPRPAPALIKAVAMSRAFIGLLFHARFVIRDLGFKISRIPRSTPQGFKSHSLSFFAAVPNGPS